MGRNQATWSVLLALIPLAYMFAVGCFFFVAPSHSLEQVLSCFSERSSGDSYNQTYYGDDNLQGSVQSLVIQAQLSLAVRMARLIGCVFLGQVLCSVSLMYPLIGEVALPSSVSGSVFVGRRENVDKHRSSVASLCLMGLLVLVSGLVDDRTNFSDDSGDNSSLYIFGDDSDYHLLPSCSTQQATTVIASGALVLILASTSMMVSFWPLCRDPILVGNSPMSTSTSASLSGSRRRRIDTPDGDAQVPLLSASDEGVAIADGENQDDAGNMENQSVEPTHVQGATSSYDTNGASLLNETTEPNNNDTETTSRLRGTTRLLKLAAPEVFYLYVGCLVLLIRLPFSLSIPHFVSTTLGAASRGDFVAARTEILLLFILGVSLVCWAVEVEVLSVLLTEITFAFWS